MEPKIRTSPVHANIPSTKTKRITVGPDVISAADASDTTKGVGLSMRGAESAWSIPIRLTWSRNAVGSSRGRNKDSVTTTISEIINVRAPPLPTDEATRVVAAIAARTVPGALVEANTDRDLDPPPDTDRGTDHPLARLIARLYQRTSSSRATYAS